MKRWSSVVPWVVTVMSLGLVGWVSYVLWHAPQRLPHGVGILQGPSPIGPDCLASWVVVYRLHDHQVLGCLHPRLAQQLWGIPQASLQYTLADTLLPAMTRTVCVMDMTGTGLHNSAVVASPTHAGWCTVPRHVAPNDMHGILEDDTIHTGEPATIWVKQPSREIHHEP
jgi:hypothetical protein